MIRDYDVRKIFWCIRHSWSLVRTFRYYPSKVRRLNRALSVKYTSTIHVLIQYLFPGGTAGCPWHLKATPSHSTRSWKNMSFPTLLPNSLYRAACFKNFEGILGSPFLSIIWVGLGLMEITLIERARPAWPAKTKLIMAKEIAIKSVIFVEERRQTLFYSRKWPE